MKEFEAVRVTDGLGFGAGPISFAKGAEAINDAEKLRRIEEGVNASQILVDVDTDAQGNMLDDDGCGDGRGVGLVLEGTEVRNKSLNRAKVFGGGGTMATAALIGMGKAKGRHLQQAFKDGMNFLKDKMIGFGAHTDDHAHGENCGCGAIDRAPEVVANVVKYEDSIRGALGALGVVSDKVDGVMAEYRSYAEEIKGQEFSGRAVAEDIMDQGKVVKRLAGAHKEIFIILNDVRGKTVNQAYVREISGDDVQAFAVDLWRLKDMAEREFPDDTDAQETALVSKLVYTLGVAGTLTSGDLPVYLLRSVPAAAAA